MKRIWVVIIAAGLAVFFSTLRFNHSQAIPSATPVCGLINSNATWSLANSPYDVCAAGVTVNTGATLTIDPGVTALFEQGSGDKLNVLGTLDAIGTDTQPITMTAVVLTPGSWRGISVDGNLAIPAVVNLQHVTLEYGGDNGSYGALIYADHANVTINRSLLRNGPGRGVYTTNNTHFDIHNTSFQGNGLEAISLHTPSTDLLMTHLTASGNGTDGVFVTGTTTWTGQRHWTNPGIPYIVDGQMINGTGDSLVIDPGSVLKFTVNGFLNIGGELKAQGTSTNPILMTGVTQASGSWRGIYVYGGAQPAVAQLDYDTVEYGGSDVAGANIFVHSGKLIAHSSIIRNSAKDGVRFDSNAGGMILNSQVYGNGNYGIYNVTPTRAVLATNTWWGDPGGPISDIPQCSSGLGDKVTAGVLFVPVLTSPTASNILPLSDAPTLGMTPRHWFAPADGTTKIYFDVTLVDGNGYPLPGRTVRLHSNLGTVTDGGITDTNGKTLAYLTSGSAGDAQVYASLDPVTACEGSLSPDATVTFTTPAPYVNLFADDSSPYSTGDIWVTPLPVVVGTPTTIYARLTNPLSTTVTTDAEFAFAQSGIGLVFGPIKTYTGLVIPANSTVVLTAPFVPSVSGHYCVQVSYSLVQIGLLNAVAQGKQLKWFNWNAQHGSVGPPDKGAGLQQTRDALKMMNRYVSLSYKNNPVKLPLALANQGIEWDLNNADKISNALQGDPPRQDYRVIDTPVVRLLPPTLPGGGISQARADALNALDNAMAQVNAYGTASTIALDRSGGAAAAGDLNWASIQTGVMLQYNLKMGQYLITAAQAIDNLIAVAASEGVTTVPITVADIISMQQDLAAGWTQQEIDDAHTIGLTDADLETIRQNILNSNPEDMAGDVIVSMQQISAQYSLLGSILENPPTFNPGYTVGAGGASLQVINNVMTQLYDQASSFILSNPNAITSLVTLSVRRIGLPADWTVDVSPAEVSLDPGQQITVTVSTVAGSPLPQGSRPRVAVEGYVNGQLLGGVVLEIVVPQYRPFDGFLRSYLSFISK